MNIATAFARNGTGWLTGQLHRVLAASIAAVLVISCVGACNRDEIVNAGCDVTAPLVEGIAIALGAVAEVAPAAVVAAGVAGVAVSDGCKHLFAQDTSPQSNGSFLQDDPLVPPQFRLPNDATICVAGSGKFQSVAAGTAVTTCQFSKNVRHAFTETGVGSVQAFSPVTSQWYDMDCAGVYPIACTGGINALVYIY